MNRRAKAKGRTFVFLGISGSGKGTQTELLLKALNNSKNVSTGEGLRKIARNKNLASRYIREVMRRGGLVPYWGAAYVWLSQFFENLKGDENVVFDGAPRRIEEAHMMDDFMMNVGRELPLAIYVKLTRKEAFRRLLKRGRFDDNVKAIRGRFDFFEKHVKPVIDYYQKRKRLVVIDGGRSVSEVWGDLRRALRLK